MKTILRKTFSLVSVLGWVGLVSWMAWGATYNFYFNNTEQGNNSTATPALVVNDGKVTKTPGEPQQTPTVVSETTPKIDLPVASGASSTTQAAVMPAGIEPDRFPRWRVVGAAAGFFNEARSNRLGSAVGVGYFVTPAISLNAFGGNDDEAPYGGAEAELRLIQVSLGRFDNVLDAGLLLGGSSLGAVSGNPASIHGGIRANLNFGDQWGFTAAVRGNFGYVMAEGGLAIRL